ncbi:unnamed protein product [Euphydryas editha]|uniref:Uncharacterized protein n=1 Tax=Euphydryas editha TaxID=104508 RepID=A0AAU9UAR7_EUPED|nr:unnamed protein product [Euphydryas editha]
MLNLEIKITIWDIERQLVIIHNVKELVKQQVSLDIFNRCTNINNHRFDKHFNRIKQNNIKKLANLVETKFKRNTLSNMNNNICNFTNVELPSEVRNILNLEPNFGIETRNNIKFLPTIIKDVEYSIASMELENCDTAEENIIKNNLRSKIVNIISNFCKKKKNVIQNKE